jgi:hypothetical protein
MPNPVIGARGVKRPSITKQEAQRKFEVGSGQLAVENRVIL